MRLRLLLLLLREIVVLVSSFRVVSWDVNTTCTAETHAALSTM